MRPVSETSAIKPVKCVVWDLDHTLWTGVLAEGDDVVLKPGLGDVLYQLDRRGILNSISSRNDHADAMRKLAQFGLAEYFLYPQIDWGAKSVGIAKIQSQLDVGMDTLLFIDDQPFERDEVRAIHPSVECVPAESYVDLLDHPRLRAAIMTEDAGRRRLMYLHEQARRQDQECFVGTPEAFLATLAMRFVISRAQEADLLRAEELTIRTNQLNATGITYDSDDLRRLMASPMHSLLICELSDRYGSYGKIGLALLEHQAQYDYIRLLLMSCRTVSRGVGSVLLTHLMQRARVRGKGLRADFRRTDRNRQMLVTYQFSGFREIERCDDRRTVFEHDLAVVQGFPPYIDVLIDY